MRENLNHTRVEAPQEALPSQAAVVPPTDGEYQSQAGHSVKVARRPVPDSREGSIEIAVIYGRGGSGREFYCLEHHTTIKARLSEVFELFLNDTSPLREPYRIASQRQKRVFGRIRSGDEPRSPLPPTLHPFLLLDPQHAEGICRSSSTGATA